MKSGLLAPKQINGMTFKTMTMNANKIQDDLIYLGNIYYGKYIIWQTSLYGCEVILCQEIGTGIKRILLTDEIAMLCGKSSIESFMSDDTTLDAANRVWKATGVFPFISADKLCEMILKSLDNERK
ncbi:MAG: hypothetical protein AB7V25_00390 [Mangrovibacterium sp.]